MEAVDLTSFNISANTLSKLEAIGIKSLYKVQSETFEHIKNGDDVITLASMSSSVDLRMFF